MRVLLRLIRSGLRVEDLLLTLVSTLKQMKDHMFLQVNEQHPHDVWLSNKEAMVRLNVSASTFYRLKKKGKLTGHRLGGRDYFRQSEIDRCYESE